MMDKESDKIYSLGYSSILLTLIIPMFFGITTFVMFKNVGNDIIISSIIGFILGFIYLGVVYYIISRNRFNNVFELNKGIFGSKFGRALNVYMTIGYFLIAMIILQGISNFINAEYLGNSNLNYIKSMILIPVIYSSTKKLTSLIKTNFIIMLISIGIVILSIVGTLGSFKFENLEPMLIASKNSIIWSTLLYFSSITIPASMLIILSKKRIEDKDKLKKTIFGTYMLSNIFQILIIIVTILVLGVDYILLCRFPEYSYLKEFQLFNIIEKIESSLALIYFFNSFCMLSFIYYYILEMLSKDRKRESSSYILSIILFFATIIFFKNDEYFSIFIEKYLIAVNGFAIFLPVIIIFIRLIFVKKENLSIKM